MKRGKRQCHPSTLYGLGWHDKDNLYDPSLRDVKAAERTLNPTSVSSTLTGGTIWGYNLTAKVAGF